MIVTEEMKQGIDRIGKAVSGIPDRVPIVAQINEHARKLGGFKAEEYYRNSKVFFENQLLVSEYYGIDFPATEYYDLYNIEAEALGQPLIWFDNMPPEVDPTRRFLKEPSDLDRLVPPDPKKSGRMPFILDLKKRALDSGFVPGVRFSAPFSLAVNLCGLQNLILGIMTNETFYHRLFTFLTDEVLAPWIFEQRKILGQNLEAMGADAYASLPNTNLEILREFALGYVQRLQKSIGNVSARGWWGERFVSSNPKKLNDFMEMKLELSPTYYSALDPDIETVGVGQFRKFTDEKNVPLMLGIDATLIAKGPVGSIVDRIRTYVQRAAQNGRLLILLNDTPRDTVPQHIHAAVHATRKYGSYPIKEDQFAEEFVLPKTMSFEEFCKKKYSQY